MQYSFCHSIKLLFIYLLVSSLSQYALGGVVSENGALSVRGASIVNQKQNKIALAGPSFFWSNTGWSGETFYTAKTVEYFVKEWNISWTRAAMGFDAKGGLLDDIANFDRVEVLIKAAIENDIYILVDFHSHHAENYVEQAVTFFDYVAKKYGHHDNIIYEIYNEPLPDADWSRVIKPYAETVIKAIRKIDPDNIIVVGTQSWSQDVDKAARDPISGFTNIAYSLHFYAGTHKKELRKKAKYAISKGLPIMVTEWGSVAATGNGKVDERETEKWLKFMREHNLSHCNWAVSAKAESSAIFKPGSNNKQKWSDSDLTQSGLLVKDIIKNWQVL